MTHSVRFIDGRMWRTPLTDVPLATIGSARLVKTHYRGVYHNEGIGGFEFWQSRTWLPVVGLQQKEGRRWNTWMVDDPVHWDGMREAVADLPNGRIVVAGLGLGLMLHHMSVQPRFTEITVVELNPDVVKLIWPTLPDDNRVTVLTDDFYHYIGSRRGQYDGVLWDLAVGNPEMTRPSFVRGQVLVGMCLGDIPMVQFGIRRTLRPLDVQATLRKDGAVHG